MSFPMGSLGIPQMFMVAPEKSEPRLVHHTSQPPISCHKIDRFNDIQGHFGSSGSHEAMGLLSMILRGCAAFSYVDSETSFLND